ncbi:MAG: TonB-dependent receptor, partial [Gammaproteobacteria bacterium]|nr:TonB-dependent receptor [Gammaproteobacteria bacterium]
VNLDTKLSDKLTFSTKNNASYSYQDGLLETSAYFSSPRSVKFFMPSIDQAYNDDGTINNTNTSLPNPLWIAQEDIDDTKFTRLISNNTLKWEMPVKNLSFTSRVNIDYKVYNYKRYRNPIQGDGAGSNGYGWQAHSNSTNYVWQNSLDYKLSVADLHNFDFKLLQEYQENRYYYLDAEGEGFADVGLTNLSSAGTPVGAFSEFEDWYIASYLGMIHYSYDGKYIADVTYRKEGSSRFSPDNRWGNFWAVGAAWNVHRESFMAGLTDVLNNLKLRASYGVSGNANIDINQYQAFLSYDASYAGSGSVYVGTFGNDDLSWETSYSLDLGADFGLFNNRIRGSVGYYSRETRDMLLDVPLSLTTGFDDQERNIGRMENKGYEIELFGDIVRSSDFNISLGGNLATNANEILELAKDPNGDDINITDTRTRVEVGHPVYGWYMPTWAGVDPATGDELWYVNPEVDNTTTNVFNDAEAVWQGGSAIPTLTAGLTLHIDYKGFFVDVNGYYAGGHQVYEGWHRYTQGTDLFTTAYYQGMNS